MLPDEARDCCCKLPLVLGFAPLSLHCGQQTGGASFFFQPAGNLASAVEMFLHTCPPYTQSLHLEQTSCNGMNGKFYEVKSRLLFQKYTRVESRSTV